VTVGPFFDKTDGVTPETALTVTSCKLTLMVDDANVPTLVLDTAPTASGGANDMVHVTGDDAGFYDLELAAGNVNYLGRAMLAITDAATHCPVFHEFMILPAMIYDSLVLGTDDLDTNVTKMNNVSASAITTIKAVQGLAVDGVITTATNVTNLPAGRVITAGDIGDFAEDTAAVVLRFNTVGITMAPIVLAGSPVISVYKDSITQRAGAEITLTPDYDGVVGLNHVLIDTSADAFYEVGKSYTVVITTGTVSGVSVVGAVVGSFSIENRFQEVDVVKLGASAQSATDLKDFADDGYDPSTNKITGVVLADTVTTYTGNTPQTGDTYALANGANGFAAIKTQTAAIETDTAEIGAAGAGLTNINLPNQTMDIVGNITGNLSGSVGSVTGAVGSVTGNVGGNVTGSVGSLAAQAKTDVNAEVLDVLNVDTFAQPGQEAPAATTTLSLMIRYLYKAFRNKKTQTSSEFKLYADDGATVDQKATHSDDATTYTSGEIGTGA